tara:strand:+ start:421 stop:564 length:144 start_codon:yes stop_codon:yes gene_type:complete
MANEVTLSTATHLLESHVIATTLAFINLQIQKRIDEYEGMNKFTNTS